MDVQLLHQIASVSVDGVRTEAEQFSYIFGRFQLSDKLQ
jgi:hypothetical protein